MTLIHEDFNDRFLTIAEVARLWNVSVGTVRNEIKRGRLKTLRFGTEGRAIRILQSEVDRLIQLAQSDEFSSPDISNN